MKNVVNRALAAKKRITIFLLALMATITFANAATKIGNFYYTLDASSLTAELVKSEGAEYSGAITIPATVTYGGKTYKVTSIGERAFYAHYSITSVKIGSNINTIKSYAFYYCYKTTSLEFSSSVTKIEGSAFGSWSALNKVVIPDIASWCNITFADADANPLKSAKHLYVGSSEITKLVIPDGVTSIKAHAFINCASITSVVVPNSIDKIEPSAFSGCTGLTKPICNSTTLLYMPSSFTGEYTIPDTLSQIGYNAFNNCSGLTSVIIPSSITKIGERAFFRCSGLTEVVLNSSIMEIGDYAFSSCTSLTSLEIPNTITQIGASAFYSCTNLTSISIPDNVTEIAKQTFYNCQNLTSVQLGNNVSSIGDGAFQQCAKIDTFVCNTVTPPAVGTNVFIGIIAPIHVIVPEGSEAAYKEADGWKFLYRGPIVTYKDWDGTILKQDTTELNGASTPPANPRREGYTFCGWDKSFSKVTDDLIVTALYLQKPPTDMPASEVGAINGIFSVAEGRQVVFSKGNLQYNAAQGTHACADGTTQPGTWRFAGEQYSVRTWDNYNRCETCDNWIDLFYYGASGYNGVMPYRDDMDVETLQQVGNVEGTNYDFGVYNAISNGGNTPGIWRLFTINEWRYLLQNRPHAYKLYNIVKINDVYGVVILPDNSDTTLLRQEINPEEYYYPYYAPSYSLNEWRQLEAKGAIFLPTGGVGSKYNGYFNYGGANERGYYMISYMPPTTYTSMSVVGLDTTTVWTGGLSSGTLYAVSVRLVQDVDVFHLNAVSNNTAWGTVSGETQYWNEPITVTATPNDGYRFVQWSDGITDNPRAFTLTADSTITAEFAPNTFTLNVSCDAEQGTINGESGAFAYLSEHTFEAVANHGYTFNRWSDGVTANPRTIVLTSDSTITALYDINYYPVVLLGHDGKLLSKQTVAYKHAAQQPEVPAREGYTFSGWSTDIESILDSTYAIALYDKIGGTVTYRSEAGDVIASENVDLHLPAAPIIAGKSFKGWLTESADTENGIVLRATYTSDNPTTSEDVTVTPSSNSADVTFPFITGALTYELVIRDLSGNVVCKIMFNSFGQLLGIAFAPSRNRNQQATQSTGFNFTVEGLNASTTYSYEFVAYDDTDDVIETLSGSFTTTADTPTNIDNAPAATAPQKYIQDGHLFIDNNNRTFDALGQQVR